MSGGSAWMEGEARVTSMVVALESFARGNPGVRCRADTLYHAVLEHAPLGDKPFWARQPPGLIVGLLRDTGPPQARRVDIGLPPLKEPISEARKALKRREIEVWEGRGTAISAPDEHWRVVDLNWLTAHEDIRRWVTGALAGPRCRLCAIIEPEPSELERVGPMSAPVHAVCAQQWLTWLQIAALHKSDEEARAADEAAGRKRREFRPNVSPFVPESPWRVGGDREGRRDQR